MTEIIFLVENDASGGFIAQAVGQAIVTEADDADSLKENVRDAVRCHYPDASQRPKMIRLHFVRDEVIAA